MIKTYSGIKGFAVFLGLVGGFVLLVLIMFWGIKEVVQLVLPLLVLVSQVLIIVFLCGVLPLSLIVKWRPDLCRYLAIMSNILGAAAWMASFLFVIRTFGVLGLLFCFLLQFLVPVALIGAVLKGSWATAGNIILWISFMYMMKFYAHWLSYMGAAKSRPRKKVIDVEIER